jgi:peptidoglycan/xylan/chitin deacetylase (PgdA/CDA1 family)
MDPDKLMRLIQTLAYLIPAFFLLFGVAVWLQPEWVIARLRRISPDVLYSVETQQPYIALTIDDGPDAQTSALILDLLTDYDARATFFLITERIPGNEALVRRMIAEGHELGNHLTADEPSIRLPIPEFESKLIQADEVLSEYSDPEWMRPGSGWYNEEMLAVVKEHNYRCALGSVYPYDPQLSWAWFSSQYVLWKVKPGDVIVLHDYQNRGQRTVAALEAILPELERRGFKVVTLSELVEVGTAQK